MVWSSHLTNLKGFKCFRPLVPSVAILFGDHTCVSYLVGTDETLLYLVLLILDKYGPISVYHFILIWFLHHLCLTWWHSLLFSAALLCPALVAPTNGGLIAASQGIGSLASYSCNEGYQMVEGSVTRTCEVEETEQGVTQAAWSGSAPKCGKFSSTKRVLCQFKQSPYSNASFQNFVVICPPSTSQNYNALSR